MTRLLLVAGWAVLASGDARAQGQAPPSYAKDVRPFLVKYCVECHNAKTFKAGLDLETYKAMKDGSDRGAVVIPGKPDESSLVILAEGKKQPRMPPKKANRHPKPAEVVVLRAWVKTGARDDTGDVKVAIPSIKPRSGATAPVQAVAYAPDGTMLVAAHGKKLAIIDSGDGTKRLDLDPAVDSDITALAFRPDGKQLALAFGRPGINGSVAVFTLDSTHGKSSRDWIQPAAHSDMVLDLAFSPDGSVLASCGYDTRIKLFDTATGKERHTLKDHSDSVYGVSFSPDGKLLASGAADRAVKVWDVAAGKLRYTLSESTDWVYAVAWNASGDRLAAGGVDRSIRVWQTGAEKGRIAKSVFAHEGAITRLVYGRGGKVLYSIGEDRQAKAWDAAQMIERKVYAPQAEMPLALAARPDARQLALGRHDGVVVLVDEATGKVQSQLRLAEAKRATAGTQALLAKNDKLPTPQVTSKSPDSGQRGRTIRLVLHGKNLDAISAIAAAHPGFKGVLLPGDRSATTLSAELFFPATTPAGVYPLTLRGPAQSISIPFTVDLFPSSAEQEPNDSPGRGQKIALPATIIGSVGKAGDADYFRFEAQKGQQIGVQVVAAALGSKLDPFLHLTDSDDRQLAESSNGLLGHVFEKPGTYTLGIRDRQLRGGSDYAYRLHLGDIPIVTALFPLGLQRGTETELLIDGVHLGGITRRRIKAPMEAPLGSKLPVNLATPLGPPLGNSQVIVGEFAEISSPGKISVPGTANGRLRQPGQADLWSFQTRKGQRLIVEVEARRLGSPLDSFIEILDARDQPIPRATLRSLAKTFVTFRDHDSQNVGIRIDAWDELAVNDFILVGNELLKIKDLPPNPDADCTFFNDRGQRIGFLDTTPTHHSMGTPMYRVEVHPPGAKFPANGFPVVTLFHRNDDGGPGLGRDSRLTFDAPADGDYRVRIGDSRGQAGVDYCYRLTVRTPRPSFNVSFSPTSPKVFKGEAVPIAVTAERTDGYEGEIAIALENLPKGFTAPRTTIPAGENSTVFALFAEPGATQPDKSYSIKLVATAAIDGKDVTRTVAGGVPTLAAPEDLVTTTEQNEVAVMPGGQTRLNVSIERRNNFKGRVPLEVRGLPHGVRVLDIGLNGILVTENEKQRTIVIYAEPWVRETAHPFVVLARREGTNAEHAARSVLLRVVGARK